MYARPQGLRTLIVARRVLDPRWYKHWDTAYQAAAAELDNDRDAKVSQVRLETWSGVVWCGAKHLSSACPCPARHNSWIWPILPLPARANGWLSELLITERMIRPNTPVRSARTQGLF